MDEHTPGQHTPPPETVLRPVPPTSAPPPTGAARVSRSPFAVTPFTRRRFLAYSGVAGAAAVAAGFATRVDWGGAQAIAAATPLDAGKGVLVVVTLYGGNDGLNTVVPVADPAYAANRPGLSYTAQQVLDLGQGMGLNPSLTGLKRLWDGGSLAIVRGVGYPQPDHSHFRSMAIWQTASPKDVLATGWLGRWLDATSTDALSALSMDSVLPPMLVGDKLQAAAYVGQQAMGAKGIVTEAMRQLGRTGTEDGRWQGAAAKAYLDLDRCAKALAPAATPAPESAESDSGEGGNAAAGATSPLARQLDQVAALVEAGLPTRVYSVSLGGFDTHADELGTQEGLLKELDAALTRFATRMAGSERGRQVATLVYSEFGRRVHVNGGGGTDHGTAGPVFLLGKGVKGGFHGEQPSLTNLDAGDLISTVDFRSVYASCLTHILGADPARILAGYDAQVDGLFT